jgi:hypothetical protein
LLPLDRCSVEISRVRYVTRTRRHFYNIQATVGEPLRPAGLCGFASVPAQLEIPLEGPRSCDPGTIGLDVTSSGRLGWPQV